MSKDGRGHVLIAGITTRGLAVSAAQAGYRVTAVDAFGDRDLREVSRVILARPSSGERYGPLEAAAAGARIPADWVAYTSNFENYPSAVAKLTAGRQLLGNTAEILSRVRNPFELARVLRRHGLPFPSTRSRSPGGQTLSRSWLLKPRKSGGGHGVRRWSPGQPVPRSMYLQERIRGIPGSISFAADGVGARVLGLSRQLIGRAEFGAGPFRYCGSIVGGSAGLFPRQHELLERATDLARVITREFQLVGLNGLDFIARDGVPYPTEVNPRYSASMELIERAHGVSMFEVHFQACHGRLPSAPRPSSTVHGKAVVFARRPVTTGELSSATNQQWLADIPHSAERIPRGRPICTVFAHSHHIEACFRLLSRRAGAVYGAMRSKARRAA